MLPSPLPRLRVFISSSRLSIGARCSTAQSRPGRRLRAVLVAHENGRRDAPERIKTRRSIATKKRAADPTWQPSAQDCCGAQGIPDGGRHHEVDWSLEQVLERLAEAEIGVG